MNLRQIATWGKQGPPALAEEPVPVRRWQWVQWQYPADRSGAVISYRTAPQRQPPCSGASGVGRLSDPDTMTTR